MPETQETARNLLPVTQPFILHSAQRPCCSPSKPDLSLPTAASFHTPFPKKLLSPWFRTRGLRDLCFLSQAVPWKESPAQFPARLQQRAGGGGGSSSAAELTAACPAREPCPTKASRATEGCPPRSSPWQSSRFFTRPETLQHPAGALASTR